jgi:small conductance mechanosensitive channel
MSIFNILQTKAPADTLNKVQAEFAAVAEKIATTPADELLGELLNKAIDFGLKVMAAFLIYLVGAWFIRKIKGILKRIFERKGTDSAVSSFVQSITSIALTVMLVITTVGILGIDTTSLAALLAGGGMAIGLALNGTVQNFAGGIMLLIFKPFKAGDFIEAQGYSGTVSELSITSTKLVTTDNRVIIIPNGILSNNIINNFSDQKFRRVDLTVDVEYGSSSDEVKQLLASMIENDIRILNTPAAPFIALSALKESSVQFTLRLWVNSSDYWNVYYELTERIYKELPENGIQFPFPQLDINIKTNN